RPVRAVRLWQPGHRTRRECPAGPPRWWPGMERQRGHPTPPAGAVVAFLPAGPGILIERQAPPRRPLRAPRSLRCVSLPLPAPANPWALRLVIQPHSGSRLIRVSWKNVTVSARPSSTTGFVESGLDLPDEIRRELECGRRIEFQGAQDFHAVQPFW